MIRVVGAVLAAVLLTGAVLPDDPLLDAIKRGDVAAVRSFLGTGADPNVAQGDGLSALHLAAGEGDLEIVKLLLSAGAEVAAKTRIGDYTPLHLAAAGAHDSIVRVLIDAGADPTAVTTTNGVTPLHLAAKATGGEAAVLALLEAGAPIDPRESAAGQTPLMFAASYGRAAAVRELMSRGANPAIRTEVVNVLEEMLIDKEAQKFLREALYDASGERPSQETTPRVLGVVYSKAVSVNGLTPTQVQAAIAAQRSFLRSDEWKLLENFHPDDLATREPSYAIDTGVEGRLKLVFRVRETLVGKTGGMTALLHAAREGHREAVEVLLDGGADINQVSGDGSSPLVIALQNGRFDLAMRLIERGADPNVATNTDGVSPLFAVLHARWSPRNADHPQPLAHHDQQSSHIDVVKALLEAGADPNVAIRTHLWYYGSTSQGIDITGSTPFWRAAFARDVEAMKILADYGADPNPPTIWGDVGLRAGQNRQPDGRNRDDSGLPIPPEGSPNMYSIHAAAGVGYMGIGGFLVNEVPNNFLNAVKYLVEEHGADVNVPDGWGYTPLHYAAVRGDNDLIEYLVSKGADVTASSRLGQSTADMARGGNAGSFGRVPYPETVALLQSLGAPLNCVSTHFRTNGNYCPGSGMPPFEEDKRAIGPHTSVIP